MATELAKAYVQIMPSADGIKQQLTNILGNNMPSGEDTGKKYGTSLISAIKKTIAAAGIGKGLASTITEGAELQQSIGGIETLFKESADKVKQNAANAYKTAGMSANEYMQLTTSFSASLLKSLGNNTSKAADIANMAMTDISDNANKMGTSMEDIKNAYQGFAKQNYTMLDNLKLGYGGTKTEMQRLLSDAQKISGVEYDINNLSDVYSAIHVIQGELDITGTTAKEAASTLSGSFASMKAALKNVLGEITLGMDVGSALNALADTVVTFLVGNLLPAVWNVISALPGAIATFIQALAPQLMEAVNSLISQISAGITTAFPQLMESASSLVTWFSEAVQSNLPILLQNGVEFVTTIINGILQNLPALITTAGQMLTTFVSTILQSLPTVLNAGSQLLLKLVNGIINNLPQIVSAAANAIAKFVSTVGQNLPQILQAGITIIGKLAAGLIRAIPTLVGKIPQIITSIKNAFTSTDWGSIGRNIISGIANGLKNAGWQLWSAVKGVLGNFKDKVLSFFGIHSPSTWGIWVGEMIDKGVGSGVTGGAGVVREAVDSLISTMSSPFNASISYGTSIGSQMYRENSDNTIIERINILITLIQAIINSDKEIVMKLKDREVGRALREMGVVFE